MTKRHRCSSSSAAERSKTTQYSPMRIWRRSLRLSSPSILIMVSSLPRYSVRSLRSEDGYHPTSNRDQKNNDDDRQEDRNRMRITAHYVSSSTPSCFAFCLLTDILLSVWQCINRIE